MLAIQADAETGAPGKVPVGSWRRWQTERQTGQDVYRLFAGEHTGIGIVSGIGGWRCFDVDRITEGGITERLLETLGFDEQYPWVTHSGSGTGIHVWFRCEEEIPPGAFAAGEKGIYSGVSQDGSFHHIELRWARCQTVVPPSLHQNGQYSFALSDDMPDEPPLLVDVDRVLAAFYGNTRQDEEKPVEATPEAGEPMTMLTPPSRYVEAVVRGVLRDLSGATVGARNNMLFRAAMRMGRLLPVSSLSRRDVEEWLEETALGIGLNLREIRQTIRSGLEIGITSPLQLPTTPGGSGTAQPESARGVETTEVPNYELELLAHLVAYPDRLYGLVDVLQPDMFSGEATRTCYVALRQIIASGGTVTRLSFEQRLKDNRALDVLADFLSRLYALAVVEEYNVDVPCEAILNSYRVRLTLRQTEVLRERVSRSVNDICEVLREHTNTLLEIESIGRKQGVYTAPEFAEHALGRTMRMHDRLAAGHPISLQTQFQALDHVTGGFGEGEVALIAGKTSSGKTAFSLQLLEHFTLGQHIPFGFISLEMSADALFRRIAAARYSLNLLHWRLRLLSPEDMAHYRKCFNLMAEEIRDVGTLLVADRPDMTPAGIEALTKRWHHQFGVQGVMVDYLGFVLPDAGRTQEEEYAQAIGGIRAGAKRTGIPHIVLSQLNRNADYQTDEPKLAHIRGSGRIEQDCHTVMFLHRMPHPVYTPGEPDPARIIVAKSRDGATGSVEMQYRREYTRWESAPVKVRTTAWVDDEEEESESEQAYF